MSPSPGAADLVLASLHLLALAGGVAGVWARARSLGGALGHPQDPGLRRAVAGHAWWVAALLLWLVTGAWRLLDAGGAAATSYLGSYASLLKVALFLALVALEAWPTATLVRWRAGRREPTVRDAGRIEVISYVQCFIVVVIVALSVHAAHGAAAARDAAPGAPAAPDSGAPAVTPPVASVAPATDPIPLEPTGTETVTAEDLALLTRQVAMPLDGTDPASLRSSFAERRGGGARQHGALDLMAPRGTPVRSAAAGRVLKLFTSAAGGLMVYAADSTERFIMLYAHLDGYAPGLRDGARVERGQVIGYVGSTGNASPTAPHLHFAIARSADVRRWSRGNPIDPLPVLQAAARSGPPAR